MDAQPFDRGGLIPGTTQVQLMVGERIVRPADGGARVYEVTADGVRDLGVLHPRPINEP